ncbi:cofactor-independent phosphoglycerate mutase [Nanoarchaeota archaeon]
MKYLIFLGDGMADYPIDSLGKKTPLEASDTPNMNELVKNSKLGRLITLPKGMPTGSAVANLTVLGYDPRECFQGRGVLEAASMGVELDKNDVALRCNLICVIDGKIKNHSAGHISDEEAKVLIEDLDEHLGNDRIEFYNGLSYRHLLVLKNNKDGEKDKDCEKEFSSKIICHPPHDFLGEDINELLIKPENDNDENSVQTSNVLNELIKKSHEILNNHPVNKKRISEGKDPANSIWPWSPGKKPKMELFEKKFGMKGAIISAVDLVKGMSVYAGLDVINVEGATGLYDTNYEGKADACVNALADHDFVYVHVEAPDEAGHEGDAELKKKTIEDFDKRLIGRVLEKIETEGNLKDNVSMAVLPDHFTPITVKTHTREPVPFMIYRPGKEGDGLSEFSEKNAEKGSFGILERDQFIKEFLR